MQAAGGDAGLRTGRQGAGVAGAGGTRQIAEPSVPGEVAGAGGGGLAGAAPAAGGQRIRQNHYGRHRAPRPVLGGAAGARRQRYGGLSAGVRRLRGSVFGGGGAAAGIRNGGAKGLGRDVPRGRDVPEAGRGTRRGERRQQGRRQGGLGQVQGGGEEAVRTLPDGGERIAGRPAGDRPGYGGVAGADGGL